MSKCYRDRYSLEERQTKAKNFQQTDPDKIMVIAEKHSKSKLPDLPNAKFLAYKHFKFGQIKNLVEKKIREKLGKEREGKQSRDIARSIGADADGLLKKQRKRWNTVHHVPGTGVFLICTRYHINNLFIELLRGTPYALWLIWRQKLQSYEQIPIFKSMVFHILFMIQINYLVLFLPQLIQVCAQIFMRGKFIVLEGLDRSGKSSITRFLSHKLSEKGPTIMMNFPDRTTNIGTMISHFLSSQIELGNEAIHLLFSANRWENSAKMENYLQKGTNIICDRYWYSGVAYSTAKGLDYQWCRASDKGLIQPDMIIYLKADPQILSKRANFGEERFQRLDFQKKVKRSFEKIFEQNPRNVHVVEVGEKTLKQVEGQIAKILDKC